MASFAISKPIVTKKAIQKHITIEKNSKDALNNVKTELQNCDVLKNINRNINSDVNSNYRLFEESIISAKTKHMHTKSYFFSKIGDQVISEIKKNNNVNVSYKQYLTNPTDARFQFEEVSVDTTMQLISKLKSKDTKVHDLISNNLLNAIKHEIVKPLTFIINQSLKPGTFPDRLKVARVRPLFKKGDNQLITKYRPISILPSLSKISEKVMHMQLIYYLVSNSLMATTQYGYRSGHSTELASLELVDRIYGHLQNNDIPCAVFCDLSKTFDCLSHRKLLDKLEYYGIRGIPLQLNKSYLQNRI